MARESFARERRSFGWALTLTAAVGFAFAPSAQAFDFTVTPSEWAGWPEFCKARYVTIPNGAESEYRNLVDPSVIQFWTDSLGTCWLGVHHYCGGLSKLDRANAMIGSQRAFMLHSTASEHFYVQKTCPRDNPFWTINQTRLAIVQAKMGSLPKAMLTLDAAIEAHPEFDGAYIARDRLLRQSGKPAEARQALLDGDKAVTTDSAELQYSLGLSYFRAKEYESARKHARRAYDLGYPLPWLRDSLAKVGYPL